MWLVLNTLNKANARLKELVPNVNSIVEAPQTDKKERRQRKKKCFDDDSDSLGKPITETTFRKTSMKDFANIA